jgi:hypothetical protein
VSQLLSELLVWVDPCLAVQSFGYFAGAVAAFMTEHDIKQVVSLLIAVVVNTGDAVLKQQAPDQGNILLVNRSRGSSAAVIICSLSSNCRRCSMGCRG